MAWSFNSETKPAMSMAATSPACHVAPGRPERVMSDDGLIGLLHEAALAVQGALDGLEDWGPSGAKAGQYLSDLVADAAAREILSAAGVGILSEESGRDDGEHDVVVVIDPLDGSTNAAHGIPWFGT